MPEYYYSTENLEFVQEPAPNTPVFVKRTYKKTYDMIERQWKGETLEKTETFPLESRGYVKELKVTQLFKRTATDMETLKPISAFFKRPVTFTVEPADEFKYLYLKVQNGSVYWTDVKSGQTMEVFKSQAGIKVVFGKETKITVKEAVELQKQPDVIGGQNVSEDLSEMETYPKSR